MDIEKYEKAIHLKRVIGELDAIIKIYEEHTDKNNLKSVFKYLPLGFCLEVGNFNVPEEIYDDIIEVMKRRRDELQKEFDEL
ncbi:MAG: hypothetical protein IKV15_00875 [Bacteroidaceae bacterium]|nr:hypothetical protein [Bacteroidaceae bacterium]